MKGLTDISGIKVGHISDYEAITGCTAILCESGAVAGVDIRGSASGTEETPALEPGHVTPQIHGIVLAGGSAFGLEAASGVRRFLEHKGVGYSTGAASVPIVPAAILYDLGVGRPNVRPTLAMGEAAAAAATDGPVAEGCVGAGTGATVGKIRGMKHAMKSGLGTATLALPNGILVSALTAVNAVGDIIDPRTGEIIAGARKDPGSGDFLNTVEYMKQHGVQPRVDPTPKNTTLAVIATNARLDKVQARKLAQLASLGMIRTINPVNTMADGDIVFAVSLGDRQADINVLGVAAAEALSSAILRAVKLARPLGGLPALGS